MKLLLASGAKEKWKSGLRSLIWESTKRLSVTRAPYSHSDIATDANKIDGLTIFDVEDEEMSTLLDINNSIHRKRLRKGTVKGLKSF